MIFLKYYQDRSLYYGNFGSSNQDYVGISSLFSNTNTINQFNYSNTVSKVGGGFNGTIYGAFSGIVTTISNKIINLGTEFTNGLSSPEINNKSGDIIYIDNRPLVTRNSRQKEDIKIILEF